MRKWNTSDENDNNNWEVKEEKTVFPFFACLTMRLQRCFTCVTYLSIILTNALWDRCHFLPLTEEEPEAWRVLLPGPRSIASEWQSCVQGHVWEWSQQSLHLSLDHDLDRMRGISQSKILAFGIKFLEFSVFSEYSLWGFAKTWDW